MDKIYKVVADTCCKEDAVVAERELGSSDLLYIYDVTNDEGQWDEEIYDEVKQLGFPDREKEVHHEDEGISWWEINVPNIGKGILFQDASPMGVAFRKEDLVKSKVNLHYDEYIK